MRSERAFPLTDQQIHIAEVKRTQGSLAQAIQLTEPAVSFPMEAFSQLQQPDQTRLLMAARISVVAHTTHARRAWEAPTAARRLGETKEIISTVYRNEHVQSALPGMQEDTQGNPYEFRTEMARDEVRYTMALAALTGNPDFLRGAIRKLNLVIETAEEQTARTLALFERDRLVLRANEGSTQAFNVLSRSYRDATRASSEAGNWERVATIASWYALDAQSQGNAPEANHAVTLFQDAVRNNPATEQIFEREQEKAASERLKLVQWEKTTPEGMDYSSLELPV